MLTDYRRCLLPLSAYCWYCWGGWRICSCGAAIFTATRLTATVCAEQSCGSARNFYDRDGEELVNNLPGYVVALRRQNSPYDAEILNLLSEIIEMPVAEMQKKIEANSDSYEPTRLKTNITPKMLTKLEEKKNELPGVMIEIQPVRNYLYKELAVHAIGYVGEVSNYDITEGSYKNMPVGSVVGKFGLEKLTTVMCADRTAVMTKKLTLEAM